MLTTESETKRCNRCKTVKPFETYDFVDGREVNRQPYGGYWNRFNNAFAKFARSVEVSSNELRRFAEAVTHRITEDSRAK